MSADPCFGLIEVPCVRPLLLALWPLGNAELNPLADMAGEEAGSKTIASIMLRFLEFHALRTGVPPNTVSTRIEIIDRLKMKQ